MTDDKEELIDETGPKSIGNNKPASSDSNSPSAERSPLHAAKSLLSSGKNVIADHNKGLWIIIISTIIFAVIITIALILTIYLVPKQIGGHAAVATEVPECSKIGLDIIKQGGNAVDAAVAAAFCLSVMHAQSSGIGGGGFLLYHDHKNGQSQAYDFRETAPAGAREAMLSDSPEAVSGASVGVPGMLKGLEEVHKEYGSMPWSGLLEPAIELALRGFNVTHSLAETFAKHVEVASMPQEPWNGLLRNYQAGNHFVMAGDIMTRTDLAATLQVIADEGSGAFYSGSFGKHFVAMVSANGGAMTMDDLKGYTVVKRDPVASSFKGFKVLGMPAPSSGPVVALILNMLEGFNWTEKNVSDPIAYHQMIETFKFAFAHRTLLADPFDSRYTEAIENTTKQFLSDEFAASLRKKIDTATHPSAYYGPQLPPVKNLGTAHISVIDASEVMISMTLTLNYWFGSKMMTQDGILANNELLDFTLSSAGESRNTMIPGKRPLSSMTPTIVYNADKPCAKRIVIGASNNTRIITGIVQTLVNAVVFDMNMTEAISRPRLHQQLYPSSETEFEDIISYNAPGGIAEFPENIVATLKSFGQNMVPVSEGTSTVQGIMKINDNIDAYSDWRKYGKAAVF